MLRDPDGTQDPPSVAGLFDNAGSFERIPFTGLFECAPVALWAKDCSGVKQYLDELQASGVCDLAAHLEAHPGAALEAIGRVRVLRANPAAVEMYGARSERELIVSLPRILTDRSQRLMGEALLRLAGGASRFSGEDVQQTLDGRLIHVRVTATTPLGHEGTLGLVYVSSQDITEHRRAEEEIRATLESIGDAFVALDREWRFVYVTAEAERVLRFRRENLLGNCFWDLYPSTLGTCVEEGFRRAAAGEVVDFENFSEPRGRWVRNRCFPRQGGGLSVYFQDITERKLAEEQLRESEEKYRQLFEMMSDALVLIDNESGRILEANSSAAAMYGYSHDELLAMSHTDVSAEPSETRRVTLRGASVVPLRWHRRRDGTVFPVEIAARHFRRDDRPVHLAAIRDIAERIRAEETLRESEARFRSLIDGAPDAVYVHTGYRFRYLNQAACRLFGADSPEQLLGTPLLDTIHPSFRPVVQQRMRLLYDEEQRLPPMEQLCLRLDGRTVPIEASPVAMVYGGEPGALVFVRDVTERKELEEKLLRAQRLETAGKIAGQVAHDFNNLLGPMLGYPELMKMQLPQDHAVVPMCDAILEAAQHMAEINTDMLTLGRRGLLGAQPVDLNRLARQCLGGLGHLSARTRVGMSLAADLPPVSGSAAQLTRVLTNLLNNALEAMQDGDTLTVTTSNVYLDHSIGRYNSVERGEYVCLVVSDTGGGIPPDVIDRVFDAFFTTKTSTKRRGSGLGLSVVQAIVEDHKGYIDLESCVGAGTTFRVYLPVHHGAVAPRLSNEIMGGTEAILVVDDDPAQREVSKQVLRSLGYRVEMAASGEEALRYLEGNQADLLVLDMIMPEGIDGLETYRRARELRPDLKAILMSGFVETDKVASAQRLGAGAYLRKPASIGQLAAAVREELERPGHDS